MPIQYKIDVISALKEAGYSTYRLRKEKLLGEATLQKFRQNQLVSWNNVSTICRLLNCQPGDIIEHIPDKTMKRNNSASPAATSYETQTAAEPKTPQKAIQAIHRSGCSKA